MVSPQQPYSTLEALPHNHSNLEPRYYSPDHPASPQLSPEVYYPQQHEPTAYAQKQEVGGYYAPGTAEKGGVGVGAAATAAGTSTEKKRYLGMTLKIALVVATVILLIIIGAVVGGVVGSRKKDTTNAPATTPAPQDVDGNSGLPSDPSNTSPSGPDSTSDGDNPTDPDPDSTPTQTPTKGGIVLPTAVEVACPEFTQQFRSDYWYTLGTRHHVHATVNASLWPVYMSGSYRHTSNPPSGSVRSILSYNDTDTTNPALHWWFQRLDREPLGQLGCNNSLAENKKRRLYKIACRLGDKIEDAEIKLGVDKGSIEAARKGGGAKPRVSLGKEDNYDLSQLWYIEYVNRTEFDWLEIRNYEGDWVLAANRFDAEPWLDANGEESEWTRFGGDMNKDLVEGNWL